MGAHPFRPTLTLTHHEGGWDGTFGAMLHEMAGVLDDSPVEARLTYWDAGIARNRTVIGSWTSYTDWERITFENGSETLTVAITEIKEMSI
ncbi:hypothetical protein PBI_HYPERION_79 [Microbacterium phage Hyperion]|uniref:Uncharacterized protein n=1 Tax=Microbacterium phage Hyperion TaxID=2182354 RepID=A0A2U8UIT1_9CAUD|nr:hypothetical protein HOT27_gp079 [Microbacterium phage Hyperion]AWN03594.1 hypothetical protein PBI_HYPERION_79 [Microbacterium phage Hyperion]QXN74003.1 hypothetical protein SEA_BLAB_77 [Microbacterium phage Blab]UJD20812.1 hypothetical protein SEA_ALUMINUMJESUS_77 [Microbacterium phage AluminumJesus]